MGKNWDSCLKGELTCRICQSREPSPLGLPRGDLSLGSPKQLVVGGGGVGAHAAHEAPHLDQERGWCVEPDELSGLRHKIMCKVKESSVYELYKIEME